MSFAVLAAAFCSTLGSAARADSASESTASEQVAADSTAGSAPAPDSTRIVRTLPTTLVRAARLDVLSSESRQRVTREQLRTLPVDRLVDALALQPGVVLDGEILHVRGARPGELRIEMDGISLSEPFRGEGLDLPLVAIEDLELIRGGLEAEHGGGLAGTLVVRPHTAGERWSSRLLWQTDGGRATNDDRLGARVSGPVPRTGMGLSLGGEARFDDTHTPNLRTEQGSRMLGGAFGWRARNQLTALARLAPVREPARFAIQALVSRRLLRPYNPMFSLDGWTTPCPDPKCVEGPAYSPTEIVGQQYARYNAADHVPVTDIQRSAVILSAQRLGARDRLRAAFGWNIERRLTSLDGRDDESYLTLDRRALFGQDEGPASDPFHVYGGDSPYFRKTRAEWIEGRVEWRRELLGGSAFGAGAAATLERLRFRQLDLGYVSSVADSARIFTAAAPGAYGWVSGRWVKEGMILNAGVRAEWFTPGRDAESMPHTGELGGVLSLSPRLGFSFPISPRDAVQVSYARIVQAPGREYLYDHRPARIVPRHPQGNPELEPSTALSFEASFRHLEGEHLSGRAGFFYRDLYRQVSARNVQVQPTGTNLLRYASEDAGRASGFEWTVEHDRPGHSRVSATYTWMRTEGSESFEDGLPFYPLLLPQPQPVAENPLAWDQPHRFSLSALWIGGTVSGSWSTLVASGLPWTPAATRRATTDLSGIHSRRLPAFTLSDLSLRLAPQRRLAGVSLGLEVRNVFDHRGQRRVSIGGFPNPVINTQYDDYAAHREQTGLGGGAYWNDIDGDGIPGWARVRDPRLDIVPRVIRLSLEREW
ncbi:MAG: TonB-dependent receptor [Candidatus Eisenbacteria bacterium]